MEENFCMEWNMEENFSMEWKISGMEWKKIASMEYGKIVFHFIPYHALLLRGPGKCLQCLLHRTLLRFSRYFLLIQYLMLNLIKCLLAAETFVIIH